VVREDRPSLEDRSLAPGVPASRVVVPAVAKGPADGLVGTEASGVTGF
jgi:hypothetical protein